VKLKFSSFVNGFLVCRCCSQTRNYSCKLRSKGHIFENFKKSATAGFNVVSSVPWHSKHSKNVYIFDTFLHTAEHSSTATGNARSPTVNCHKIHQCCGRRWPHIH